MYGPMDFWSHFGLRESSFYNVEERNHLKLESSGEGCKTSTNINYNMWWCQEKGPLSSPTSFFQE